MGSLPVLLERSRHNGEAEVEILEALETFPSTLPTKRDSSYAGWVSISVGCNNTCTFCIVPSLRGKEKDRRPGDILAEIQALVDDGVIEVTLLGQNVNTYGVEFGDKLAFGKLLRAAGTIEGLERIRFTSPHPAAFTEDVIDAMAETPQVMPQLHMPLQSGSDRVLKAMRRSYRSEKYLGILDRVREKIPHAAITTDIIVGFPGETEEDFEDTLGRRASRFMQAFTFQYSIRQALPRLRWTTRFPKRSFKSATSACRAAGSDFVGRKHRNRWAPSSMCWWPTTRVAKMTPRSVCRVVRRMADWCTSRSTSQRDPRPGDVVRSGSPRLTLSFCSQMAPRWDWRFGEPAPVTPGIAGKQKAAELPPRKHHQGCCEPGDAGTQGSRPLSLMTATLRRSLRSFLPSSPLLALPGPERVTSPSQLQGSSLRRVCGGRSSTLMRCSSIEEWTLGRRNFRKLSVREFPTTFLTCGKSPGKPASLTTKHRASCHTRRPISGLCRFLWAGPVCMSHRFSMSLSFREPTRRCGPGWRRLESGGCARLAGRACGQGSSGRCGHRSPRTRGELSGLSRLLRSPESLLVRGWTLSIAPGRSARSCLDSIESERARHSTG
jgi:hypothetical protein